MTRGLSSKARAARSLFFAAALLAPVFLQAQNILQKKITAKFGGMKLSEALQQIEEQTNVHFIYSSNVVDPSKKVTSTQGRQSLGEILDTFSRDFNLEFKTVNEYVIIKKAAAIPAPPTLTLTVQKTETTQESEPASEEPAQFIRARHYTESNYTQRFDLSNHLYRNNLFKLDSARLRNTLLTIKPSSRVKASRFFASAGLFVNDFSGGVEIQAGLRRLYGVFNTSFADDGYVRLGYGLGSNIPLGNRFSVSPVYTFASFKQISSGGLTTISEDGYFIKAQHHQIKLMVQYSFARNFVAKLGPTFNFMSLNFTEQQQQFISAAGRVQGRYQAQPNHQGNIFFLDPKAQYTNFTSPNSSYDAYKSWVGFEAGIYYSINFSKGR